VVHCSLSKRIEIWLGGRRRLENRHSFISAHLRLQALQSFP